MSVGFRAGMTAAAAAVLCTVALAAEVADHVKTIQAVGPEGQGNKAAAVAVRELSKLGPDKLPELLAALDTASPRAANYLRAAIQSVAQTAGKSLSPKPLEAFVKDLKHEAAARKLAYDLLVKVDPTAPDRLIPGFIDDPSPELRREAVQQFIDAGNKAVEAKQDTQAKAAFQRAMQSARDDDQIKILVKQLASYGEKIQLTQHFGFLTTWHLIGPFDNTEEKGFNVAYPPEKGVDLAAEVEGKEGKKLKWIEFTIPEEAEPEKCGIVDLKKALDHYKGAITYAYAEFESPKAQSVDVRMGTPNAWKVWINGQLVRGREEYHRGEKLDQYKMQAALKPGKNQILVKVCQNEQTDDWAQRWEFRLRVCDSVGTAVLPANKKTALRTNEKGAQAQ